MTTTTGFFGFPYRRFVAAAAIIVVLLTIAAIGQLNFLVYLEQALTEVTRRSAHPYQMQLS